VIAPELIDDLDHDRRASRWSAQRAMIQIMEAGG